MATKWWSLAVAVLLTVLLTHTYMVYGTDKVAAVTGYLVALGVIPVVLGAALGAVGANIVAKTDGVEMKSLLYIPAISGASALLPIGWTLLMMSQAQ